MKHQSAPQALRRSHGSRLTTALWALGGALLGACSSGEPTPDGDGEPSTPANAWAMFVLEPQFDAEGFLQVQYEYPTRVFPIDEFSVADFGASSETRALLTAYLQEVFVAAGQPASALQLTFDYTGTFATMELPQSVAAVLYPDIAAQKTKWPTTLPVPFELQTAVTDIVGTFDMWNCTGMICQPGPSPIAPLRGGNRPSGDGPNAWSAYPWSMGSGTHPKFKVGDQEVDCPPAPATCTCGFENPGPPNDFTVFQPSQLRTAYDVPDELRGKGRSAAILMWGSTADPKDVDLYASYVGSKFTSATQLNQLSVGPNSSTEVNYGEVLLDVTTILGMAPDIDRISVVNGPVYNYSYRSVVSALMGIPFMLAAALDPQNTGGVQVDVVSASFGAAESGYALDRAAFDATNRALTRVLSAAAMQGVTVTVASGDSGSIAAPPAGAPLHGVQVSFPSAHPYVTSVGGTNLRLHGDNSILKSEVWNDYPLSTTSFQPAWPNVAGGGGSSMLYDKPWWQRSAEVPGEGRAQPDVSFLADQYPGAFAVNLNGGPDGGGTDTGNGTSQSAPLFAGMIVLFNEALAKKPGAPRVGLAGPLLYELARKHPSAFYDIDTGNNIASGGRDESGKPTVDCCYAGPGYDRASGWGSLLLSHAIEGWEHLDSLAPLR